jgi:hypothetical protein
VIFESLAIADVVCGQENAAGVSRLQHDPEKFRIRSCGKNKELEQDE